MFHSRLSAGLALAAVLTAGPAAAQTALTPGHPDLASPPPQSFAYEVRMAGTPGRVIGSQTQGETLSGDRLVMASSVSVAMARQDHADTLVVAWPSLAPLSLAVRAPDTRVAVSYEGGRVAGRSVLGNLDEALDAPLPAGAFGPGVGPRLARSLPFADGFEATFETVDAHGAASTGRLRVVEASTAARADGTDVAVWLVELAEPGTYAMTYAVDAATREILGATVRPTPQMVVTIGPPRAAD